MLSKLSLYKAPYSRCSKYTRRVKKKYSEINSVKFYKLTLKKLCQPKKTLLMIVQLKNMIEFALKHKIIPMRPPEILPNIKVRTRKIKGEKKLSKLREYMIYDT